MSDGRVLMGVSPAYNNYHVSVYSNNKPVVIVCINKDNGEVCALFGTIKREGKDCLIAYDNNANVCYEQAIDVVDTNKDSSMP